MAKISLRAYNNEINDLIDHAQLDEAIAHCKHILQHFPRHVDTYRLLGKCYLEGKRYGDAADILQRVLSSIPDDFIANVGMSIIREDEGNLDAAIYHMERSFENQPSNQAIQEELRRLYGKRDGIEPDKIRLTQGSLARMYSHGNLFDQAIAELLTALSDDPQRLDLQVLLSEMFFQVGRQVEAVESSNKVLAKLPNCLDASRILYLALKDGDRYKEAQNFLARWAALDPYAQFIGKNDLDTSNVPDHMVTLEQLDYHPGQREGVSGPAPPWVAPLGTATKKGGEAQEPLPDWLLAVKQDDEAPAAIPADEEKTEPDRQHTAAEMMAGDEGVLAENAADEDVPDWMKGMEDSIGDQILDTEPESEALPDWLQSFEKKDEATSLAAEGEPTADWMKLDRAAGEEENGADDDIPDLLKEAGWETSSDEQESAAPASDAEFESEDEISKGEIPDWMRELEPPEPIPSALSDETAAAQGEDEEEIDEDWLRSLAAPKQGSDDIGEAGEQAAGADDWQRSLAEPELGAEAEGEEQGAGEETKYDEDWLRSLAEPELGTEPEDEAEEDGEQAAGDEDWLRSLAEPGFEADEEGEEEGAGEQAAGDEDWLRSLAEPELGAEEEGEEQGAGEETKYDEDWLRSLAEPELGTEPEDEEEATAAEKAVDEDRLRSLAEPELGAEEEGEEEEAGVNEDWLRSLAEPELGAEEEGEKEEAGVNDDWLRSLAEPELGAEAEGEEEGAGEEAFEEDWLSSLAEPELGAEEEGEEEEAVDENWLRSLAEPELGAEEEGEEEEAVDEDRLRSLAEPELGAEEEGEKEEARVNEDWLRSLAEPGFEADEEGEEEGIVDETSVDEDWLRSLAEPELGAEEEGEEEEAVDEDWLRSLAEPELGAEAVGEKEEAGVNEDWLRSLAEPELGAEEEGEEEGAGEEAVDEDRLRSLAEPELGAEEEGEEEGAGVNEDWLRSLAEPELGAEEEGEEEGIAEDTAVDEDRLRSLAEPELGAEEEGEKEGAGEEAVDEDWLRSLAEPEGKNKEAEAQEESTEAWLQSMQEDDSDQTGLDIEDDDFSWLDEVDEDVQKPVETADDETQAAAPLPTGTQSDADWLRSLREGEEEEVGSFLDQGEPETLSFFTEEEIPADRPAEKGRSQDWVSSLEKMEEGTAPRSDEDKEESSEIADISGGLQGSGKEGSEWQPVDLQAEAGSVSSEPKQAGRHRKKGSALQTEKKPAIKAEKNLLKAAQKALENGDMDLAVKHCDKLIRKGIHLDQIMLAINDSLRKYPLSAQLWQLMGDLYMRQDKLQEALDAYNKAEELL